MEDDEGRVVTTKGQAVMPRTRQTCPGIFVCFSFLFFFLLLLLTTLFSDMTMTDDEASILAMRDDDR
jgi:hypothetical protein